jgi:outer membrane protein TolC
MNRKILIALFCLAGYLSQSQEPVTLDLCREKAVANYPLTRQSELLPESHDLKIGNLNKNYLPQMNVSGQASYQSDVTKTPFQNIPGVNVPTVSKDWYKIVLDVNQVIYDGSATPRQKAVEDAGLEIDRQSLEVELFKLKDRVNQVYFNILLIKESRKVIELYHENLLAKLKDVESGVKNGTILQSNADVLSAEIIKSEQSLAEAGITLLSLIGMMNEFTGMTLNENTVFALPDVQVISGEFLNNRPEYTLFGLQQNKINASQKLLGSSLLPRFSAFGQAGYGRPGYDMLKDEFDDFYMIGARLSWKPWDWSHSKKEKEILSLQSEIIATQKETFDMNLRIDLQNKIAEIRKAEELISRDEQLIALREKITKASSSQLDNGIITSTQYLTELTAESNARLDLESHKIKLVKAKLDYKTTLGN